MENYLKVIDQINEKFEQFKMLVLQETNEVKELESYQLTPQQEIIMFYIIRNEPTTAIEIANYLNISKSAVSQVIPRLEEKELLERKVNHLNRRETFIYLGSKGKEYQNLLNRIDELLVRKYYSKVSIEELKYVLKTLTKIVDSSKI